MTYDDAVQRREALDTLGGLCPEIVCDACRGEGYQFHMWTDLDGNEQDDYEPCDACGGQGVVWPAS